MPSPYEIGESWYELNQLFEQDWSDSAAAQEYWYYDTYGSGGAGGLSWEEAQGTGLEEFEAWQSTDVNDWLMNQMVDWYGDAWYAWNPSTSENIDENDPNFWSDLGPQYNMFWGPISQFGSSMPMGYNPEEIYYAGESSDIQKDILQGSFLQGKIGDIQRLAGLSGLAMSGVGAHTDLYTALEESYEDIDIQEEQILFDLYNDWGESWYNQLGAIGDQGAFSTGEGSPYEETPDWVLEGVEGENPWSESGGTTENMQYNQCIGNALQEAIAEGFGMESMDIAISTCSGLFELGGDE